MILRPYRTLDARRLVSDVRPEDRREWEEAAAALSTDAPLVGLVLGCMFNSVAGSALTDEDGRVLCIWGASEVRPGVGLAWLIASNRGQRLAPYIQRYFVRGIAELHAAFPVLEAHAFNGNTLHHRWMERLGFVRGGPSSLIPGGQFTVFTRSSAPACA